jgi:hypothetical protein
MALPIVMAGLVPAIHEPTAVKAWMTGSSPVMTDVGYAKKGDKNG